MIDLQYIMSDDTKHNESNKLVQDWIEQTALNALQMSENEHLSIYGLNLLAVGYAAVFAACVAVV